MMEVQNRRESVLLEKLLLQLKIMLAEKIIEPCDYLLERDKLYARFGAKEEKKLSMQKAG